MEIKLYKPIMVDGKEVKTLEPDFENMPSGTSMRASRFLQGRGYNVTLSATDEQLNAIIAAMAAGLAPEDAWALHDKDKRRLAGEALAFFLDTSAEP